MNKNTLKLAKLLPKNILSRDVVRSILEQEIQAMDSKIIFLDLSKIEFISRSAAHELLKMKERFEYNSNNKKEIIFKDLSPGVAAMIRIVAANKAYSVNREAEFKPKRVNIGDLVKI